MTFSESDRELVDDLAAELAKLPAPPPTAQHETAIAPVNAQDQGALRQGRMYVELRRPNGDLCWMPQDNLAVYTAKGFVPTGQQADSDIWNLERARADKWRGF